MLNVSDQCQSTASYNLPLVKDGSVGRPKKYISAEQIIYLKKFCNNWTDLAKILNTSRSTLYRRRKSLGITVPIIDDHQLNREISNILSHTPNAGEVYVLGSLRSRGISVSRWRVREQLQLIDPIGRNLRKTYTIQRRTYKVKGPNYLW